MAGNRSSGLSVPYVGRPQLAHSRGQALIEAVLASSALALLASLVVILARYQAVDMTAVRAARAMSFECAAVPQRCQSASAQRQFVQVARRHHFGGTADGLRMNHLWTTRAGEPLLEKTDDVTVQISRPHFGAGIGVVTNGRRSAAGSAVRVVSRLAGPGKFGLDITAGLVSTGITANLLKSRGEPDPALIYSGMPLSPHARHTVLVDAWNASSPYGPSHTTVQTRVEQGQGLPGVVEKALAVAYTPTRLFIRMMGVASLESTADKFRYHETDVDLVPADRLGTR